MQRLELPLYLKMSSIYNKILQLGIAVLLLLLILNIWVNNLYDSQDEVNRQFHQRGSEHLSQAIISTKVFLSQNQTDDLKQFIKSLPESDVIYSASFYDETGQLVVASGQSESIKELFGLGPNNSEKETLQVVPFMQEVRSDKLLGYLRITLDKRKLIDPMMANIESASQIVSLIILLACGVGFFLTRSFARFSRQGVRVKR